MVLSIRLYSTMTPEVLKMAKKWTSLHSYIEFYLVGDSIYVQTKRRKWMIFKGHSLTGKLFKKNFHLDILTLLKVPTVAPTIYQHVAFTPQHLTKTPKFTIMQSLASLNIRNSLISYFLPNPGRQVKIR